MLRQTAAALANASAPFVDSVKVLLCSGSGGDGASVMSHEHCNEFAGPGGGNGGNGGNVMLRCAKRCRDLSHVAALGTQIKANDGSCGYARRSHGRRGADLWLEVPVGTVVSDVDTNVSLYDLSEDGLEVLLLEGGQGGKGNATFANKWHHSPIESTRGLPGNTLLAQLEVKTMADCGLVGYPNAGKSSLLSAISSSSPPVGHYTFTTTRPYVGVIHDLYGNTCSVADLPGLIEGAFENRGLGHQFLRHVERTKVVAFVVDMSDAFDPINSGKPLQPWEVVTSLSQELDYYQPNFSRKAAMVFANKMDQEKDSTGALLLHKLEELKRRVPLPVFPVSAAIGKELGYRDSRSGLAPALQYLCERVFAQRANELTTARKRQANESERLQRVFEGKNNGLFLRQYEGCADTGPELSLVDQQLGMHGGSSSSLGSDYDGYVSSTARGKLFEYRDVTMKGKYWSLTRQQGERLRGERWK